jgi:hypothetical protein
MNHFPLKFNDTITKHSNLGNGLGDFDHASTPSIGVFFPYFGEIIIL